MTRTAEITVTLPRTLWWTSNDLRGSHHIWDGKIRSVRILGRSAAVQSRTPQLTPPVTLHVHVGYPTNVIADPPNIAGTVAKAALDGIVSAGVLPDDDSRYIHLTAYSREPHKAPRGTHTLRFVFTEVAS